eukprot:13896619-Alexandrium_andersonii.AAC.1
MARWGALPYKALARLAHDVLGAPVSDAKSACRACFKELARADPAKLHRATQRILGNDDRPVRAGLLRFVEEANGERSDRCSAVAATKLMAHARGPLATRK